MKLLNKLQKFFSVCSDANEVISNVKPSQARWRGLRPFRSTGTFSGALLCATSIFQYYLRGSVAVGARVIGLIFASLQAIFAFVFSSYLVRLSHSVKNWRCAFGSPCYLLRGGNGRRLRPGCYHQHGHSLVCRS